MVVGLASQRPEVQPLETAVLCRAVVVESSHNECCPLPATSLIPTKQKKKKKKKQTFCAIRGWEAMGGGGGGGLYTSLYKTDHMMCCYGNIR